MLNTINDIIDISKIDSGHIEVVINNLNIIDEIESLYRFFKVDAANNGLQLLLKNELPADNPHFGTDRAKFNSIFTNLIKNAIKLTDTGIIEIGCSEKDGQLQCYIKDTGIGIPENRKRPFLNVSSRSILKVFLHCKEPV
jgi:signal transduction histidine kinase